MTDLTGNAIVADPQRNVTMDARDRWLQSQGLPLGTQMDNNQRRGFLDYVKQEYHNSPLQQSLQERDKHGGVKNVRLNKRSRWCREMQRQCGSAHVWERISFTGQ